MDFNTELANFRKGLILRNKINSNYNSNSVIDEIIIKKSISLGYDDAKRTFKGIGKSTSNAKNNAFDNLKINILNYFSSSAPSSWGDYCKYHEKWCDDFINDLRPYAATCGQAQKIINMTMKYIYCLSSDKRNHFKYCHMALDSYILAWYNKQKIGKKTNTAWSTLDITEYKKIQNNIYQYLSGDSPKYFKRMFGKNKLSTEALQLDKEPIKAEFVIWACEINFNKLKDAYDTINEIENKSIDISLLTNDDTHTFLMALFDLLQTSV